MVVALVALRAAPVEAVDVSESTSKLPLVIEVVESVSAFCVVSEFQFQICAQLALLMEFVAVAAVRPESERLAVPLQPTQEPVIVTLFSVVVPLIAALPAMLTLPLK